MISHLMEKFYSVSEFYTSLEDSVVESIGEKQWAAMRKCEAEYDQLPMTDFGNVKFSDNVWYTNREGVQFNWDYELLPNNQNYPLILLLKLATYHRVQVQKYSSSSATNGLVTFIRFWSSILGREHILHAKVNQAFVPAEVMTLEKFHGLCVESVEKKTLKADYLIERWSSNLLKTPDHVFKDVPFLRFNFKVPWHKIKNKIGQLPPSQLYINELLGKNATRTELRSYKPFSSSVVAKIVDGAIPIVTIHADAFSEIFRAVQNNNPWVDQESDIDNWVDVDLTDSFLHDVESNKKLIKNVLDNNIDAIKTLPELYEGYCEAGEDIPNVSWFYSLHQHCLSAGIWVILFTTGLRNIDIRLSLLRDCYVKDPDSDLIYYLVTDLQKVSKDDYPIPIPPQTMQAIDLLNAINLAPSKVNNLVCRMYLFGSSKYWHINDGHQMNQMLRTFALRYGADLLDGLEGNDRVEGVCHRARVTMAEWIGTNSPLAVLIVKRLFGHTNDIMPDHYLRHNKLVQIEREEIQKSTYISLADDVAEAVVEENFSGGMKKTITDDVKVIQDKIVTENQSMTGIEIRKTLKSHIKEVLYSRLINGNMLGLQTPLGFICMRNPQSNKPSPCAGEQQNQQLADANIDKRFMRALQGNSLPNLDNCKGPDCQHSLLIDKGVTKLLLESFHYYCTYLKRVDQYSTADLDTEAHNFINLYYPSLQEVYPDIAVKAEVE
jgi:hypothetical protein